MLLVHAAAVTVCSVFIILLVVMATDKHNRTHILCVVWPGAVPTAMVASIGENLKNSFGSVDAFQEAI